MSNTRHFSFIHHALSYREGLVTEGNVPDRQSYDGYVHTPDYRLVPLTVRPYVTAAHAHGNLGSVQSALTNVSWALVQGDGTATPLPFDGKDFSWEKEGAHAGRLRVKRNALPGEPLTLRFTADHLDTRSGDVHHVVLTHTVYCDNAAFVPVCVRLDSRGQRFYNPLRDASRLVLRPTVSRDTRELSPSSCEIVWEQQVRDSHGKSGYASLSGAGLSVESDDRLLLDFSVYDFSGSGNRLTLRCRARERGMSEWSDDTVSVVRRVPEIEVSYTDVPSHLNPDVRSIRPRAVVRDVKGEIPDADRHLAFTWWARTGSATGPGAWKKVGEGARPVLSTDFMDTRYGGELKLEWSLR